MNIEPLTRCNFEQLNELIMNKNKLTNIDLFTKCNFSTLNIFIIHNNQIANIDALQNFKMNELRTFYIYGNRISKTLKKNIATIQGIKARNSNSSDSIYIDQDEKKIHKKTIIQN